MRKHWGKYKVMAFGKGWKVKLLIMEPYSATSIQKHQYRNEFWFDIGTQEVVLVPVNAWHQLENNHGHVRKVLELQFGKKCLESDEIKKKHKIGKIIRFKRGK